MVLQPALAVASGGLVGFTLGLIGGGGSIMATPLLLYVVGLPPHAAIGTGALAVSFNAFANFASHARAGNVRWRDAGLFAVIGAGGAAIGSWIGKDVDGQRLLFLFALLMMVVGVLMLRRGGNAAPGDQEETRRLPLVIPASACVGLLSGFFGIGGGFLIVPGLIFSTGMPMLDAVGSSCSPSAPSASPRPPTTPSRAWSTGRLPSNTSPAGWPAAISACSSPAGWPRARRR
jgi:uncharacterized membrane protein YfcA